MKHRPIDQQVVVIMGAASGIGRETALRFAARGARTLVADIDEAGLQSLAAEIRSQGGVTVPYTVDVADFEQVRKVANAAVEQYGRLDTWAHIAATSIYARVLDTTPEEYRRVLDVDFLGEVYGAKAALPRLLESGGGALIHVSSIEAMRAVPLHSAYGAAKHAVHGFLQALRVELQHDKLPVSVTEIMPASINTPFFDKAKTKIGVKPKGVPPLYDPGLVAEAILYAAERGPREMIVGGAGKALVWTERLSPVVLDAVLSRVGFAAQRTSEPRSSDAPNDLYGPAGQYNTVEGDFGGLTFSHSITSWLDRHPGMKAVGTAGAMAALGAVAARRARENTHS